MRTAILFCFFIIYACGNKTDKNQTFKFPDTVENESATAIPPQEINNFPNGNFEQLVEIYEDPNRRNWQNPDLVLNMLGNLNKKTVADIGSGTGYFAIRIAQFADKVIAIDIDERFLDYIEERKLEIADTIAQRIVTRLTNEDDPSLSPNEADVALLVNTYPFIDNRPVYFSQVKRGLKPDGKLVILDYKKGDIPVGPPDEIKISPEQVFAELRQAGFQEFSIDEKSLEYQYVIIAE
ncbi:MAG: class I SAM-dependent methyltransferase [Cyclobacteriaceae bacterium]